MSNAWERKRARRALVQAVYQWQLAGADTAVIEREFLTGKSLQRADSEYFSLALRAVTLRSDELDALFADALDRDFAALDQVERAILRLGAWELAERLDVPYRVVINEWVELAKTFGAEESHKYINSILDGMAGQLRAAEKNVDGRV